MIHWLRENAWSHVDFSAPWRARWRAAAGVGGALALIGLFLAWRRAAAMGWGAALGASVWIWIVGAALAGAVLAPVAGRFAYCGLMAATGLIGAGISLLLLLLLFYCVFTPVSAALRLMGKDLLRRRGFRRGEKQDALWIKHRGLPEKGRYHHLS